MAKTRASAGAPKAVSKERIRAAGLRWTAPRAAVLDALERARAPMSHSEIVDEVAKSGFDRATIYRNLIDLTDAGLLSRTDLGDHVWRFEMRRADHDHGAEHAHFMCTSCGFVSCLPEETVRVTVAQKGPAVARIAEILVKGQCTACV